MIKMKIIILMLVFFIVSSIQDNVNYYESKVPDFKLPNLLITKNDEKIQNQEDWIQKRRPEILSLFKNMVYGKIPGELTASSFKIVEQSDKALNNKAVRKQVRLNFTGNNGKKLRVGLLIYLPENCKKAPLFVGYNFYGNQTIIDDPEILITKSWIRNSQSFGIVGNQATEQSRGVRSNRWPVEKIIDSGYGLATIYYGDVDPDRNNFLDGVHSLLYTERQSKPLPGEWGAITAWAWGLSRAMDYFEKDSDIDHARIIVMGHSRLGKTSLWAGALDQRFAVVISNDSGCGGAALSRRRFGETVSIINDSFPHWFCDNFNAFNNNEDALPVDQHMLIALIAPRPVYVASAEEDRWADPKGEFLSVYYASPVYELFGKQGLTSDRMPHVNNPVMNSVGYHIRTGKHDVTNYDWEQFITFANMHLQ